MCRFFHIWCLKGAGRQKTIAIAGPNLPLRTRTRTPASGMRAYALHSFFLVLVAAHFSPTMVNGFKPVLLWLALCQTISMRISRFIKHATVCHTCDPQIPLFKQFYISERNNSHLCSIAGVLCGHSRLCLWPWTSIHMLCFSPLLFLSYRCVVEHPFIFCRLASL